MIKILTIIILLFSLSIFVGCENIQQVAFSKLTGDYWQIWTMSADGKYPKQITVSSSDKRYPVWNTEGNKIYFRDNDNRAFVIDNDKKEESRILESFGSIGKVMPSGDGKKLLFVRFRTELLDSSDLWTTSLDGKNQQILTRDVGLQYDPTWSSDGEKIAYISGHGYGTHELYIMDADGKNKKWLTNNKVLELLPAFSHDGSKIAYVSDLTGDFEIWTMNTDGTEQKQLTHSEGIDTRPCWSSDDKQIMFVSNRTGSLQIWIMNNDGNDLRQITKGSQSNDPDWKVLPK